MNLNRSVGRTSIQRRNAIDPTIRLDLTQNPHGPCPAAIEAVELPPLEVKGKADPLHTFNVVALRGVEWSQDPTRV